MPVRVVDTCDSAWIFDDVRHRFRRLLKGADEEGFVFATEWRAYDHVLLDRGSDAFIVFLDNSRRRVLRARRHIAEPCTQCGGGDASTTLADSLGGVLGMIEPVSSDRSRQSAQSA
jgi:hypothetical protein